MVAVVAFARCSSPAEDGGAPVVSSRAYRGHEADVDITNLVTAYPKLAGSRLDDCHTCHAGSADGRGGSVNACDNCHGLMLDQAGHSFVETLNDFGADYGQAGRSAGALGQIDGDDSDDDGFANGEELAAGRYPGDPGSRPDQQTAPLRIVSLAELKAMPAHDELLLANARKQPYDGYAAYRGVQIDVLLQHLGVDLAGVTGATVVAPDGFVKSVDVEDLTRAYPPSVFHAGLDTATLGAECGFVDYPESLPEGLADGAEIPDEQRVLLAWERDGGPMEPSYLDVTAGKIQGEGPLRLVVPQATPGPPDRGLSNSPTNCGDDHDYAESADHNAGAMVRGVIALRVDPMPEGVEEFDRANGGWAYVDAEQLVVYGHGVE